MFPTFEGFCHPITGEPNGGIAGYVAENEGNILRPRVCFQCENNIEQLLTIP